MTKHGLFLIIIRWKQINEYNLNTQLKIKKERILLLESRPLG